MFKVIMVVLVGAAFVVSWYASDIRRLTRDYRATAPFDGPVVEALVRFALAEYRAHCSIGANSEGLYIAPSAMAGTVNIVNRWWHPGYRIIKTPLFIPWTALEYHAATMPFGAHIRFDVPSLRIGLSPVCFFIPRTDAEPLLASVGRQVSPG
jgi:hypothetical protein